MFRKLALAAFLIYHIDFASTQCSDSDSRCSTWISTGFCSNSFYTQAQRCHYCGSSCDCCSGGSTKRSCFKTFNSTYILWNDLVSFPGKASFECCQLCQKNALCKAYTWTNTNGGTCHLKNDTQPIITASGIADITGIMSRTPDETYSLIKTYAGRNFFDDFFFGTYGQVQGFTRFADNATAWKDGLFSYKGDKIYLGVDHTNVVPSGTWGRLGFRLNTFQIYNADLFMLDLDHVPTGVVVNSTAWHSSPIWPAWWMEGIGSEFDIFEMYEPYNWAYVTLHDWNWKKYGNCTMFSDIARYYNGRGWEYEGMSQRTPYGTGLGPVNAAGGGVYVMQWEHGRFIRVWTFSSRISLPIY